MIGVEVRSGRLEGEERTASNVHRLSADAVEGRSGPIDAGWRRGEGGLAWSGHGARGVRVPYGRMS